MGSTENYYKCSICWPRAITAPYRPREPCQSLQLATTIGQSTCLPGRYLSSLGRLSCLSSRPLSSLTWWGLALSTTLNYDVQKCLSTILLYGKYNIARHV